MPPLPRTDGCGPVVGCGVVSPPPVVVPPSVRAPVGVVVDDDGFVEVEDVEVVDELVDVEDWVVVVVVDEPPAQ